MPAPVLTAALFERFSSRGEADFADKLLSAMRFEFGGHLEMGGLDRAPQAPPRSRAPAEPWRSASVVVGVLGGHERAPQSPHSLRGPGGAVAPLGRARDWEAGHCAQNPHSLARPGGAGAPLGYASAREAGVRGGR